MSAALAVLWFGAPPPSPTSAAAPGPAPVAAELTAAEIDSRVSASVEAIEACYAAALAADPALTGTVELRFEVGKDGCVGSYQMVGESLGDVALCLGSVVMGWCFSHPLAKPIAVTYPFVIDATHEEVSTVALDDAAVAALVAALGVKGPKGAPGAKAAAKGAARGSANGLKGALDLRGVLGLQPGDTLEAINGCRTADAAGLELALIRLHGAPRPWVLELWRGSDELVLALDARGVAAPATAPGAYRGTWPTCPPAAPQTLVPLHSGATFRGWRILDITDRSPLAGGDLRPGDVVVRIDGCQLAPAARLAAALARLALPGEHTVELLREQQIQWISLEGHDVADGPRPAALGPCD